MGPPMRPTGYPAQVYGGADAGADTQPEKPPSNILWIRRVPRNVKEADVEAHFKNYREICSVTTYKADKTYAFVRFKETEEARSAKLGLQGSVLGGKSIHIEFAKQQGKPCKSLWVCGIRQFDTDDDFKIEFLKYGDIETFSCKKEKNTATVEYFTLKDATNALETIMSGKGAMHVDYNSQYTEREFLPAGSPEKGESSSTDPPEGLPPGNKVTEFHVSGWVWTEKARLYCKRENEPLQKLDKKALLVGTNYDEKRNINHICYTQNLKAKAEKRDAPLARKVSEIKDTFRGWNEESKLTAHYMEMSALDVSAIHLPEVKLDIAKETLDRTWFMVSNIDLNSNDLKEVNKNYRKREYQKHSGQEQGDPRMNISYYTYLVVQLFNQVNSDWIVNIKETIPNFEKKLKKKLGVNAKIELAQATWFTGLGMKSCNKDVYLLYQIVVGYNSRTWTISNYKDEGFIYIDKSKRWEEKTRGISNILKAELEDLESKYIVLPNGSVDQVLTAINQCSSESSSESSGESSGSKGGRKKRLKMCNDDQWYKRGGGVHRGGRRGGGKS